MTKLQATINFMADDNLVHEVMGENNTFQRLPLYPGKKALVLYTELPKSWQGLNAVHRAAITLTPKLIRVKAETVEGMHVGDSITLDYAGELGVTQSPDSTSRKRPMELVGISKLTKVSGTDESVSGNEDVEELPW